MSQIQFKRGKTWQDKLRDYRVLIDGRYVAAISGNSDVTVPVVPGKHVIQLTVDWCKSPIVEVAVEQDKGLVMECGPNSNPFLGILYITLLRNKYIWLKPAAVTA